MVEHIDLNAVYPGMVEALIGAMQHAAKLHADDPAPVVTFTNQLRKHIHEAMVAGKGTRDLCGPDGLTTEEFIAEITARIEGKVPPARVVRQGSKVDRQLRRNYQVDKEAITEMFSKYDMDGNGMVDIEEFSQMLIDLDIAPKQKLVEKASSDTQTD